MMKNGEHIWKFPDPQWSQEHINQVIDYLSFNSQATLNKLKEEFVTPHNFPNMSISTLWNYLDEEIIT